MSVPVKLNLGCGERHIPGYVNVDRCGTPDVTHDLEKFPWPWEDNAVEEVLMTHVLEHLGATTEVFLAIMKELYRVCKNGARIQVTVPYPRHDDFINDPTHVRALTAESFVLFSKAKNREWRNTYANSPLGIYADVDFEVIDIKYTPDGIWLEKLAKNECTNDDVFTANRLYNNVIRQIQVTVKVVKP